MPNALKYCQFILYADDNYLTHSGFLRNEYSVFCEVNQDLEKINEWLDQNEMSLNYDKTELLVVGTKTMCDILNDCDVVINGFVVKIH